MPEEIAVRDVALVSDAFHARYSARSREYIYSVLNSDVRSPLRERFCWRVAGEIDTACMNEAAGCLIGTHDFAAFGQATTGSVTVRTLFHAEWIRKGRDFKFSILANAYLRKMVRRLVGTLLWVGQGRISGREFRDILRAADIRRSAPPAPACGLCLVRVDY